MAKENIKHIVTDLLEDFLAKQGYELYDVKFVKEAKDWFLRVYIERSSEESEENVGLDDCEKVSRFLSQQLDEKDPIDQNYYLEVSSPGMDRELRKEADYQRFAGKQIEVKLYKPINGIKKIEGTLTGLSAGNVIIIDLQEQKWELPLEQVAKANLAVVF